MKSAALAAVPNESDPTLWKFDDVFPLASPAAEAPARNIRFHTSVDRTMNLQVWEFWGQLACKTWQTLDDGVWKEGAALLDDYGIWHISGSFPRILELRDEQGRAIGSSLELPLPSGTVARRSIRHSTLP